jgi:integrase
MKASKVRPITVHGLRDTSATLLLKAGVPAQVVQQRLGHKRIEITATYYRQCSKMPPEDWRRYCTAEELRGTLFNER